jgi:FG-GAP-like repeat
MTDLSNRPWLFEEIPRNLVVVLLFATLWAPLLSREPDAEAARELFFTRRDFVTGGIGPWSVIAADYNEDTVLDLAVGNRTSKTLAILDGNGDGSFAFPRTIPVPTHNKKSSSPPISFNREDNHTDLAVALVETDEGTSNLISVLLGNGDGTFRNPQNFQVGTRPTWIDGADFNEDGLVDLSVTNRESDNIAILLGNGDGTFQGAKFFPAGDGPRFGDVGDFNKDQNLDIVVVNWLSHNVSIFLGNGDGTFQNSTHFSVGRAPGAVSIADFDRDGSEDLAVGNCGCSTPFPDNTVSILLGNGDGTFQNAQNYQVGMGPSSTAVADIDEDGLLDIVVANWGTYTTAGSTISILLGNGDGTFQRARGFPVGNAPTEVIIADFNGDRHPDLAVANNGSNTVSILLNGKPKVHLPLILKSQV